MPDSALLGSDEQISSFCDTVISGICSNTAAATSSDTAAKSKLFACASNRSGTNNSPDNVVMRIVIHS